MTSRDLDGSVWVGVRPEKVTLQAPGEGQRDRLNRLGGAVVTDVSYVGVSTQYLVRLPSGQLLTAFAQNTGLGGVLPVGERVTASWDPAHAFGLDRQEDADAGVETLVAADGDPARDVALASALALLTGASPFSRDSVDSASSPNRSRSRR